MPASWTSLGLDEICEDDPLAYTIAGDTPGQSVDLDALHEIFHEQTKYHRATSVGIAATIRAHLEHPDLIRRGVMGRHQRTGPGLTLPAPMELDATLTDMLARRITSRRERIGGEISARALSSLLYHSAYAERSSSLEAMPDLTQFFRPYPSAGALYPCEIYLVINAVSGVPAGVFRYDAIKHGLVQTPAGRSPASDETGFCAVESGPADRRAPACAVVVTSVFERSTRKYGLRGYRLALIEAGHILQNLSLVATSLGLRSQVSASFYETELEDLIGVDGVSEAVLATFLVGEPTAKSDT